ncbi:MAG: hypothetical protein COT89_00825 [Candidatus Colwellbacteria bacterium CG10_big_fil_rev_8_21_14_0_10_42_22]|uniref:NAD-dependent epimerase/dehydratase domain-containing protein n=1 Tax=Candidatus Colwellbacteria bacterium CG10_big_fil_rev_8_21_14_0_10_42_22 TaxID=1974540 RepID=A0A2H0VGK5_9BACT|nr:MAG: hypothetical protein COT89_00825 [Candidatus Colwellbacteria bacterium CG10_big_fil_rev_8_21_14_0_10_42_22]
MKILVTGGAGYIGSVLVPKLLELGHEVTVIDSFMFGQRSLFDVMYNRNLNLLKGDVRDEDLMSEHMKDKDFIIPLAALVGAPLCDKSPEEAKGVNLDAIELIIKLRDKDTQKIIFPNTNSGYGYMEEGTSFCDEQSPLHPVSLYGKLKVDAEKALLDDGEAITLRLATVFGISPRMRLDLLVNDFVFTAVKERRMKVFQPHAKRNYIHVRDVVKAFIHAMNNFEKMKNEPYNVGLSTANLSKQELCEEIKKQISEFEYEISEGEDPDKRDYIVSNEKIEKTGFKPDHSIQDGIRELIKGYQEIDSKEGLSNI